MAYEDLWEGTYCPAVSLYTNPTQQAEPASVTVNFGEDGFAFEPPQLAGCPPPRAACEMCGPRPGAEVAAAAAEQQQQEPALAAQEEGQQQASGGRQGTEQPQQQTEEQRGEGQLPRGTQAADGEAALLSDAPAAAAVQA
jgi:Set1/Ash2 histone methyltransferase complex subunit ASH2